MTWRKSDWLIVPEVGRAGYMKRPAETESFEGNMSVCWTRRPSKEENRLSWKRDCERMQPKLVVSKVRFTIGASCHGTEFGGTSVECREDGAGRGWANVEEAQEEFGRGSADAPVHAPPGISGPAT